VRRQFVRPGALRVTNWIYPLSARSLLYALLTTVG
jgi:hypothetical protein